MAFFHVIIPAAGSGSRMGAEAPKQYLSLNGKPLIQHVLKMFEQATKIHTIHVILDAKDTHWRNSNIKISAKTLVHYCGGDTRAATVLNGLNAIRAKVKDDDWVLVHDSARPGLTNRLLNELIKCLENDPVGGLLAIPLADTLKKSDSNNKVQATVPRKQLWQAQTPQMFRYSTLKNALESFKGVPTDEAEAVEALGLSPQLVTGELRNLKITYPQDLAVLAALLNVN